MKLPKLAQLIPYVPTTYLPRLQAIQNTVDKVQRAPGVRKRDLPSIFERQPVLAEKLRRKALAGPAEQSNRGIAIDVAYESGGAVQVTRKTPEWRPARGGRAAPFFKDEAHKRPTRALYRALLRQCAKHGDLVQPVDSYHKEGAVDTGSRRIKAPRLPGIAARLRYDWRRHRHQTSIPLARNFLSSQYDLLDQLSVSSAADID